MTCSVTCVDLEGVQEPTNPIFPTLQLRSLATYSATSVNVNSENRKHFFDNPHRYDSEADNLIQSSSFHRSRWAIHSASQALYECPGLLG